MKHQQQNDYTAPEIWMFVLQPEAALLGGSDVRGGVCEDYDEEDYVW